MDPYYCIVGLPADPVAELRVLDALTDADALAQTRALARDWPPYATLRLHHGERLVATLGDGLREAA
jgi:hypothetical protein